VTPSRAALVVTAALATAACASVSAGQASRGSADGSGVSTAPSIRSGTSSAVASRLTWTPQTSVTPSLVNPSSPSAARSSSQAVVVSPLPESATSAAGQPVAPGPAAVISTAGKYYSPVPVPSGDQFLSVDLHNGGPSWLLLSVPCSTGRCVQLARSDDQGRSWHRLPVTAITVADWSPQCPPACPVHRVRFVTADDGYLFGPGLFLTTDGGRSWHDAHPPAAVQGVGAVGDVVVRTTSGWCQKSADTCNASIDYAEPGSNAWRPVSHPPLGYPYSLTLVAPGGTRAAYVLRPDNMAGGGAHPPVILRSQDGRAWQSIPDACAGDGKEATGLAAAASRVLLLCMQKGGDGATNLRFSADGGDRFSLPAPAGVSWAGNLVLLAGRTLVASGPTSGGGQTTLQVASSSDDGQHWQIVDQAHVTLTTDGVSLSLSADSGSDVAWVVTPVELRLSHDGGRTWTHLAGGGI
jgi:hypothetical protein